MLDEDDTKLRRNFVATSVRRQQPDHQVDQVKDKLGTGQVGQKIVGFGFHGTHCADQGVSSHAKVRQSAVGSSIGETAWTAAGMPETQTPP